jgi:hypothetical protein
MYTNPPKTAYEVYNMLPYVKIELIDGKIRWGAKPDEPDSEFEEEIQVVINRHMEQAVPDTILLAAYLNECLKAYKNARR